MKKALILAGGGFLVLIVAAGIGAGIRFLNNSALDRESKAFADSAIPAIVSEWNIRELMARSSSGFREKLRKKEFSNRFALFARIGKMKRYSPSVGDTNFNFSFSSGAEITADYSAIASFENGTAQVEVSLVKRGKKWLISDFRVNSGAFR